MKQRVEFSYTEVVVPPRCRKPRPVTFDDGVIEVEICEVSAEDAPLAIVEYDCLSGVTRYRWHGERLWTRRSTFRKNDPCYSLDDVRLVPSCRLTRAEAEAEVAAKAEQYVLIDGEVWKPAGEPRYVIMTFGLGCNHGGTALMTANAYNSNVGHQRYYSILQLAEAAAEAERIALARGDTKNVPITPHALFYVLIPEAVRVNPSAEHGDGCPFLNRGEEIIESAKDPIVAGLGMIMELLKD